MICMCLMAAPAWKVGGALSTVLSGCIQALMVNNGPSVCPSAISMEWEKDTHPFRITHLRGAICGLYVGARVPVGFTGVLIGKRIASSRHERQVWRRHEPPRPAALLLQELRRRAMHAAGAACRG